MRLIDMTDDQLKAACNPVQTKRHRLNLTQAELAPLLGISLKTIKNWEQGIRKPSKAALMLLDLELKK